ncbi:hypothetical protein KJ612_02125, partial [Myxococcota bacterium]|nr:hypothetical protein [Myxococcota bacterium]
MTRFLLIINLATVLFLAACDDGAKSNNQTNNLNNVNNINNLNNLNNLNNVNNGACGDGVTATGEACDDGNTAPADGCAADCTVEDR